MYKNEWESMLNRSKGNCTEGISRKEKKICKNLLENGIKTTKQD